MRLFLPFTNKLDCHSPDVTILNPSVKVDFLMWKVANHMNFTLIQAEYTESDRIFSLLKSASKRIENKGLKQWDYWQNPPAEKRIWIINGVRKKEFFFLESNNREIIGMVRILDEDLIYWGKRPEKSKYIHSLVVREKFAGKNIGVQLIQQIAKEAELQACQFLRLDCDSANSKLCEYYENQGFIKVGEKELSISTYNLYQKSLL